MTNQHDTNCKLVPRGPPAERPAVTTNVDTRALLSAAELVTRGVFVTNADVDLRALSPPATEVCASSAVVMSHSLLTSPSLSVVVDEQLPKSRAPGVGVGGMSVSAEDGVGKLLEKDAK